MADSNSRKYPPVVIVNENDEEIGSAMLAEAWQKGLYHRIVAIFVEDDQGRMLLQLRSPRVGYYPNCWDQAAGGHVDEGHGYDQAAATELAEELGIPSGTALTTLETLRTNEELSDGRIVNRFERVYLAHLPHDIELKPEPEEVSKLQWFTPSELKVEVARDPQAFTPGLLRALDKHFPAFSANIVETPTSA